MDTLIHNYEFNWPGVMCGWSFVLKDVPGSYVRLQQEHGKRIVETSPSGVSTEQSPLYADGHYTTRPGLSLVIQTADCVPVFFYMPGVVGVIHAGWRGTAQNISGIMVQKFRMIQRETDTLLVGIGHCIRACHYEIRKDVADQFCDYPGALITRKGKMYLDLVDVNRQQLIAAGVAPDTIHDAGVCTYCNLSLPSYRRDGERSGRIYHYSMLT